MQMDCVRSGVLQGYRCLIIEEKPLEAQQVASCCAGWWRGSSKSTGKGGTDEEKTDDQVGKAAEGI